VGEDLSIRELWELIADVVGFHGRMETDLSKPDGAPRKLLDVSRINSLGWQAQISLREGLASTYAWLRAPA
jgi:GDP-L-fucose synthase